jgi:thiol-disulfide isomerase/thioredoxin
MTHALRRLLLMVLFLAGCTGSQVPTASDPAPIAVRVADAAALQEALVRHRGQVVLVDFWATWCGPCVELFPHTVELHRQFIARGLAVIAVSMNDPEEQEAVTKFLADRQATFENFISRYGLGSQSFEAFQLGALPQYRLYDRQGALHKTFGGNGEPIAPEELDRAVEALLAK